MILETLVVFAGATGDQELLCPLQENVARTIRESEKVVYIAVIYILCITLN